MSEEYRSILVLWGRGHVLLASGVLLRLDARYCLRGTGPEARSCFYKETRQPLLMK